jgi:hypothetical protein
MQLDGMTVSLMPSMPTRNYVASLEEVAVGMQPIVSEWSQGKSFGKLLACLSSESGGRVQRRRRPRARVRWRQRHPGPQP